MLPTLVGSSLLGSKLSLSEIFKYSKVYQKSIDNIYKLNIKMIKSNQKVTEKRNGTREKMKKEKIPVTFNEEQLKLIENFEGVLGNTKAEIVRNIVINWILEKKGGGK